MCIPMLVTTHVETIALLQKSNRKSKPDTYVKLSLDMEDYYRIMDAEGNAPGCNCREGKEISAETENHI
jgi:hypothetical protein